MENILVFGDSITFGAWDIEGGWVQRLRKFLDEKTIINLNIHSFHLTYNVGISGDTTEDLLERFEFETKQRSKETKDLILIFSIGGNDSTFIQSKNDNWVKPQKFKENIQKLISLARNFSSKIIFVGLTPADESKTTPLSWNEDMYNKNESIKKYNDMVKSVCKENNILFINIFENFMKEDYKNLLEKDGLHPNSKGHKKIYEIVKDFLIENKIIRK